MDTLLSTRFRRRWRGGALALSLVLTLACSGKKDREAPRPEPATGSQAARPGVWTLEGAAAPYRGVTLRAIGESLPPLEAMAKLATQFEQQTGIKVEVEMYEHSEAVSKVMLDLNSHRGRYDFILQPHRELGRFVKNGHLKEVKSFMDNPALRDPSFKPEEQLFQRQWKEISWYDGKVYGFPFTALTMYLWYRKDLFEDPKERAGFKAKYGYEMKVPTTWKEYTDLAAFFHRPSERFYGTAIQGKRHEALWYEWLNFLYSFGGDMMETQTGSSCGPIIVNSPEAVASLDYYKSLIAYSPPDTLNYFWDDVMALMQQGKVFELLMWTDATYAVEDPKQSKVSGKMAFDLTPQDKGGKVGQIEGWSYLIPTDSKNPEAAYLFIQWMMGFERQRTQHLNGGSSARPDVYADPSVKALSYSKASVDTFAVARPKPTIPESPQITEILVRELSLALTGKKTSKEALDTAAAEMSKLLGACAPMKYPVN
ncbi:MAG TPA: sugar ABC transporter substrate-binding protein [Kofleriaceae bacterium]|nr:sugar ABC transporter substrate-binding protein [Kofleriaceae bacterium]